MSLIRGTSLQGFADLVAEFGQDPQQPRLPGSSAHAGDPDAFLSDRAVVDAIESGAIATGAGDFGRRLAQRQGLDILGTGRGCGADRSDGRCCTGGDWAVHVGVQPCPADDRRASACSDLARFTFGIVLERLPDHRQVVELALGVVFGVPSDC